MPKGPTALRVVGALLAALAVGLPFTAQHEGRPPTTYVDSGGVVTGGYGHTGADVPKAGTPVSEQQATEWLAEDLMKHGLKIVGPRCLHADVAVELAPETLASFQDFAFNVGVGAFCSSTLVKKANAGDTAGACREFDRWVFVKGKDCRLKSSNCGGIPRRRAEQRALCEKGLKQ